MFLIGVFLGDSSPLDPAPPVLDFTGVSDFTEIAPAIAQTFFIGDGLTGEGTGTLQRFDVPAGATRLFLGFADAAWSGPPGYYDDNLGALTASVAINSGGAPTVTPTFTATPVPPVVVLVHGIDPWHTDDDKCGMDPLKSFLDNKANTGNVQFRTDCQIYKSRSGIEAGAYELKRKVDGWNAAGIAKVDIVVHSMGGLVARYYLQNLGGAPHVRSLTMIGTPNLGSKVAEPLCNFWSWRALFHLGEYDYGACEMIPGNTYFLAPLNSDPNPPAGVSYRVLTGDRDSIASRAYFGEPADCMVPVSSAFGTGKLNFPHDLPFNASHANVGVYCLSPGELDSTDVQGRVAQLLLASNGFAAAAIPATSGVSNALGDTPTPTDTPTATATAIPTESAASMIASQAGVIASGGTVDLPVTMPAAQTTGTFVFTAPDDPSASLSFSLLRPNGTPVATTDADVTYDAGSGFGGVQAQYTIANPAAGTWTMRVTGTTVPVTGWPYDMQALVPGGISVTAGAGAGHYDVGTAIDLSADVAVNATPYAGATVNATITKPDSSTAVVALTDAGGGSYTGSFGDTSACGLYQITVTADGSDNGTPFSRQDRTLAFVGVPGNVIMDPCVADSDGDGLTDSDEINVYGTNPASVDTDADMCGDAKELALVPPTDGANPWDFYSVPVPALFAAPTPLATFADNIVSAGDAQAVFGYFKKAAKTGSAEYEEDLNANGIKDGVEYDRSVIVGSPGASGPPNGVISAADAQLAFAQFKFGYKC